MADPFSITASALTVLQVAAGVVNCIRALRDASHELKKVQADIESLQTVLSRVRELCEHADKPGSMAQNLECYHLPLKECLEQLEKLRGKFQPINSLNRARKSMAWKFHQGDIKDILSSIERQKSMLMVGLQVETQ